MTLDRSFVVLWHWDVAEPHFDFMIEAAPGELLHTWRCRNNPLVMYVTAGERIKDHRPDYLDYEGEVSGNRGRVARVAQGRCAFREIRPGLWLFSTNFPAVRRHFYMKPVSEASELWVIEAADPDPPEARS